MSYKGITQIDLYKALREKFFNEEKVYQMNLSKYINSIEVVDFGHNLGQKGIFYWSWKYCSFILVY